VNVEVRLYATLAEHVREASIGEPIDLEISDESSIADLIEGLNIPPGEVHLVIVDGRMVHDRTSRLADGSRVALFPPVGGG
jgi:molybdopterin converting factor small subunit